MTVPAPAIPFDTVLQHPLLHRLREADVIRQRDSTAFLCDAYATFCRLAPTLATDVQIMAAWLEMTARLESITTVNVRYLCETELLARQILRT